MAITKAQWKEIAEQLSHPYGRVELKCGDRSVVLRVERTKALKYSIITYVDGEWRGEWLREESEIGKLFLYRRERYAHSLKAREAYIKAMGGKRCSKAHREIAEVKYAFHDIAWPSATPLRRHYTKKHPDAELIRLGHPSDGLSSNVNVENALGSSISSDGIDEPRHKPYCASSEPAAGCACQHLVSASVQPGYPT
jgi:hypothetical protein